MSNLPPPRSESASDTISKVQPETSSRSRAISNSEKFENILNSLSTKSILGIALSCFVCGLGIAGVVVRRQNLKASKIVPNTAAVRSSVRRRPSSQTPTKVSGPNTTDQSTTKSTTQPFRLEKSKVSTSPQSVRLKKEPEPDLNDVLFALKAFGYGTAICISVFGVSILGISRWLDVHSIPEFHSRLQESLTPKLNQLHAYLISKTKWLRKNADQDEIDPKLKKIKEEEEWNQLVALWEGEKQRAEEGIENS
ncbi:hypothetical protein BKA69DRAFT_1072450 [Paraphysoderma sedebokerense]|nr:hypothetical protein BKA69DRAFT_1072450 [Paraphysoderma sedebokerense]